MLGCGGLSIFKEIASGIGGGVIADGRAIRGRDGYAGEIGHLSVDPVGPKCACGATGCLEALVRREQLLAVLGLHEADDLELEQALRESKAPAVAALLAQHWSWLRTALRGIVNMLNPEKIVLGGHLAIVWNTISDADRGLAFEDALNASSQAVVVEAAALGPDRLILGAAELVWDQHITNPLADPAAAHS